jgi:hypothetical protein
MFDFSGGAFHMNTHSIALIVLLLAEDLRVAIKSH